MQAQKRKRERKMEFIKHKEEKTCVSLFDKYEELYNIEKEIRRNRRKG